MSVRLFSSKLEVTIVPVWGGKTTSVWHRERQEELLFRAESPPASRDTFGPWAFGWDDCWPSVNNGGDGYPDHGALWRMQAVVVQKTQTQLTVEFTDPSARWNVRKNWEVVDEDVVVTVELSNPARVAWDGFWTIHALVRLENDQILRFPDADERTTVFGEDFAPASLPPAGQSSKFWLPQKVTRGYCGILYPQLGMEYSLFWDPAQLPYLGYWGTNGGFQNQRNQAWEPSDGYYDSVDIAWRNGALPRLEPGQSKSFQYRMRWAPIPR